MLFLITGQPGNGKTLYGLWHVEKLRQAEGRAVYYFGIKGLSLPWTPVPMMQSPFTEKQVKEGYPALVPDWDSVPDGSIVVVDECHKIFPPRSASKIAPAYVQFLAEHRHRGFDVFVITQGHADIDGFLRSRVGKHFHLDRRFGVEASRLWQWERCANPTTAKDKAEGQSSRWSFPKEAYQWYTSSVEHTHKRDLPWRKIGLLVGASVVVVCSVAFFLHNFLHGPGSGSKNSAGGEGSAVKVDPTLKVLDSGAAYWGRGRVERVVGLPQSAAIYDELQKVKSQPRVEGCMRMDRDHVVQCSCSGPNGAELELPVSMCMRLIKAGWFDETRKYEDVKARNIAFLDSESGGMAPAVDSDTHSSSASQQSAGRSASAAGASGASDAGASTPPTVSVYEPSLVK